MGFGRQIQIGPVMCRQWLSLSWQMCLMKSFAKCALPWI